MYELMLLFDPARGEEQQQELLTEYEDLIRKHGGEPKDRDVWGKRRLAYPIQKRRDGYYAILWFEAETTSPVLKEIDLFSRYHDDVLRHLTTEAVVGKSKGDPARIQNADPSRMSVAGQQHHARRVAQQRTEVAEEARQEREQPSESQPAAEEKPAESAPTAESAPAEEQKPAEETPASAPATESAESQEPKE